MACALPLVVLLGFLDVKCDATITNAQEETCVDAHHVQQQLVQARRSLVEAKKDAEEEGVDGAKQSTCPWHMTDGHGCHRNPDQRAKCKDGTYSWSCVKEKRGERQQCPCSSAYMCAEKKCGGGEDYCCEKSCEKYGGIRKCHGKPEVEPTGEPMVVEDVEPEAEPTPEPTPEPTLAPTPEPTPAPTPAPSPQLTYLGADPNGKLGLCVGDCDKDSGCEKGLKCFQRSGYTMVPGCEGVGNKDSDYCYDPQLPNLPSLENVAKDPKETLEECFGDCDSDADCMPGLACYQRDGKTPVPGCSGAGKKDWDYCYKPVLNIVSKDPKAILGSCSGDCDSDSNCAPGLKCHQRDADEEVLGCSGEAAPAWDYCYNPAS